MGLEPSGSGSSFPATLWTVVLSARDQSLPALTRLCETYRPAVYAFLRSRDVPAQEVDDVAQGFFEMVLQPDFLKDIDRSKGRFRSFLLAALRHFLSRNGEAARALKRGGGVPTLSLDATDGGAALHVADKDPQPDVMFDRAWGAALFSAALARLQAEASTAKRQELVRQVLPTLYGEGIEECHALIAERLGMNEGAVRIATHRIRLRFRQIVREELAATLADGADVDAELRELIGIMSRWNGT